MHFNVRTAMNGAGCKPLLQIQDFPRDKTASVGRGATGVTPLSIVKLFSLTEESTGSKDIAVGLIDGPVDVTHPDFEGADIKTVSTDSAVACQAQMSPACIHGTFVAGLLSARKGSSSAAICPQSPLLARPI